jgi:hypothetical protein
MGSDIVFSGLKAYGKAERYQAAGHQDRRRNPELRVKPKWRPADETILIAECRPPAQMSGQAESEPPE